MHSIILPVHHRQQREPGECLAACALMLLDFIRVSVAYDRLLKLLEVDRGVGTPSYKIRNLTKLNISVTYEQGTLNHLHQHLLQGRPCIAFVKTADLPHWDANVDHAVVVVGMDDDYIYLHDPEFEIAPLLTPIGDFDLAWLARGELYAVLTLPLR